MKEIKGFYLPMYYCGYVNGRYYNFPTEEEYLEYMRGTKSLYTEDLLREICLGLNSMCKGAESKFFNGYTNISDGRFICFGVKGLMDSNKKLKDAMLFNILSFMNNKLLTDGNTVRPFNIAAALSIS